MREGIPPHLYIMSVGANGVFVPNPHGMHANVEAMFQWFQEKVQNAGGKLILTRHDKTQVNDHSAERMTHDWIWTRGYYGVIGRGDIQKHPDDQTDHGMYNFQVRCCAENGYEAVIYSERTFFSHEVWAGPPQRRMRRPMPIYFTVASSFRYDWIYDIDWVLRAAYTVTYQLIGRPPLLYPSRPYIQWGFLYRKLGQYIDGISPQPDDVPQYKMYMGKNRLDKHDDILLNPQAFMPFTPPSAPDEAIHVTLMGDRAVHGAGLGGAFIRITWYSRTLEKDGGMVWDAHYKDMDIEACPDALAREQAIDQALHNLLPSQGL